MADRTRRGMRGRSRVSVDKTDAELAERELELLRGTAVDWEALRPHIADQALYDRLMRAVQAATAGNESLAQLRHRIETLGREGVALAKKLTGFL